MPEPTPIPHPERCPDCARCAAETDGAVSLCLWHQYEANRYLYGGWRAKTLNIDGFPDENPRPREATDA